MASHRGNRHSIATAAYNISSLSSALARVQRLTDTNTITIARKIGFTIGLELAKGRRGQYTDIHSELSSLSRRLNLGKVILHEWSPVVFVTRTDSKARGLEAAFGEGVLEGIVHARSRERVFIKHSESLESRESSGRFVLHRKPRGAEKL